MSTTEDICANCGKPSQSGATGSLTQWVFLCKCDALAPKKAQGNTIRICLQCGKRIGAGRSGTFTQWIFRADVCDCENPQPVEKSIRSLSDVEFESTSVDLSSIIEIDVDKETFPIERFAPIEILGSTYGSTVYLAIDKMLGTRVAIKSVALNNAESVVRFQKEVKALASLSHPGIVKVLDFAEKEGAPYMVMEFIDGVTLREFLKRNSKLSVDETVVVIKSLCQTLSYCHGKNVLHRDIKPENLLVRADAEPLEIKLVDFGLACTYDTTDKQGDTIAGTPTYMAPDVSKGKSYDSRSEVYSTGCVFFELLTGTPPYDADNSLQLIKMHADADIPEVNLPGISGSFEKQLKEIVTKCLAKEPDDRFQTMEELRLALEDLDIAVNENPDGDNTIENPEKSKVVLSTLEPPHKKKNDIFAMATVLAVVSILGVIAGFVFLSNQSKRTKTKSEVFTFKGENSEAGFFNMDEVIKVKTQDRNKEQEHKTSAKLNDDYLKTLTKNADSNLKEIMLNGYEPVSADLLATFFERAKDLRIVNFANRLCRPEYIKVVSRDKNLRVIRLIAPTPEVVKAIPRDLKSLTTIAINNTKVTAEHIAALSEISGFDNLRFNFCDLDNGALEATSRLNILHFSFANCSFFLDDFASLKDQKQIRFIRMKNLTVRDKSVKGSLNANSAIPEEFLKSGKFILSSQNDPLSAAPESVIKAVSQTNVARLYIENMIFKKSTLLMLAKIKRLKRIDFRRCVLELGAKNALIKAKPGIRLIEMDTMSVEMEKYRNK